MHNKMVMLTTLVFTVVVSVPFFHRSYAGAELSVKHMECPHEELHKSDDIIHYQAYNFGFFNVFSNHRVIMKSANQLKFVHKTSKADLINALKPKQAGFFGSLFSQAIGSITDASNQYGNETGIEMSPFLDNYIGFSSSDTVSMICDFSAFDPKLLGLYLIGTLVFLLAESISRNVLLYYASGVIISLFMSWMIILIIILRLIPYKKSIFVSTIIFGGSFGLYLTQSLLLNLQFLAKYYADWLIRYTVIVGVLSLAYLYYKGPPKTPSFFNLVQLSMQLLGLMCIYNSTWAREVAVTAIVFSIALHLYLKYLHSSAHFKELNFTVIWNIFKWNHQPSKRKLLTEEEYEEEGKRATAKAIEELRGYCSSPECNTWKFVSRLKDPKKFASFIENGKSFNDDELAEYERFTPKEDNESWLSSDEGEERQQCEDENSELSISFSDSDI